MPGSERPKRIQRKRTKGWKMPEGTIYVGRPTVWGNPFWHAQKFHGVVKAIDLYRQLFLGWNPSVAAGLPTFTSIYQDHCDWLKRLNRQPLEAVRSELRGHDLACWCRLDQPCHADVLLELANAD